MDLKEFVRQNEKMNSSLITDWNRDMLLQAMQMYADEQLRLYRVGNCADSSKRPKPYEWLKVEKFNITQGSTYNEPKFSMRQCASWISEYVKKHCC